MIGAFMDIWLRDPQSGWHPIALMGRLIQRLEKHLYKDSILAGSLFLLLTSSLMVVMGILCDLYLPWFGKELLIFFLCASGSMRIALRDIRKSLEAGQIDKGRGQVQMIVSRSTNDLNQEEIIRTALESGAENYVDGVLAPLFYLGLGLILGFPITLLLVIKMISTLDAMIGYRNETYERFGKASALADDLIMFIPARISPFVLSMVAGFSGHSLRRGWFTYGQYRRRSSSPNSGHSESFVAGLLGISFGGPVRYFGKLVTNPTIGKGHHKPRLSMIYALEGWILKSALLIWGGMICLYYLKTGTVMM